MKNIALDFLRSIFDIQDGREVEQKIVENIKKNIEFRGANLWILIFAIFIASIGLNINSIAIIIGAMLISPLMSPIVGIGLSLGIQDVKLLRLSIWNLSIATIISIIISTIYFYFTPISNVQSEILARTSPNIYDVLIAFFGGLAGIVGSTRMEKGNVIPGVAIATALMPPLCTAGYGIATGQLNFFLGALYLFAINCIFIFLATLMGVKYMKLPKVSFIDEKQSTKMNRIIATLVVAMIVPAIYFAYVLVKENNFNQNAQKYLEEVFNNNGHAIIYQKLEYKKSPHKIELAFLSRHFSPEEIAGFENMLAGYGLSNTQLIIKQDNASLSEDEWNNVIADIKNDSEKLKAIEAKLSSSFVSPSTISQILQEAQSINEKIERIAVGNLSMAGGNTPDGFVGQENLNEVMTVVFFLKSNERPISTQEKDMLTGWMRSRMQNEDMLIYFFSE